MLYYIILSVIILICVLLTIVILLQPGQGSGMTGGLAAGSMAGGGGLGARRTADLLSKSTSILGGALLVLCVLANFAIDRQEVNQPAVQQSGVETTQGMNNPSQSAPPIPQTNTGDNTGSDATTGGDSGGGEN
ncbi:MAG: preprotein translocase subunit SecG [Balneolaceae bacterium]|nr:preprotein translocase subunit SecG [Balneolaceae bacterium]